jgi:hypothetical protein
VKKESVPNPTVKEPIVEKPKMEEPIDEQPKMEEPKVEINKSPRAPQYQDEPVKATNPNDLLLPYSDLGQQFQKPSEPESQILHFDPSKPPVTVPQIEEPVIAAPVVTQPVVEAPKINQPEVPKIPETPVEKMSSPDQPKLNDVKKEAPQLQEPKAPTVDKIEEPKIDPVVVPEVKANDPILKKPTDDINMNPVPNKPEVPQAPSMKDSPKDTMDSMNPNDLLLPYSDLSFVYKKADEPQSQILHYQKGEKPVTVNLPPPIEGTPQKDIPTFQNPVIAAPLKVNPEMPKEPEMTLNGPTEKFDTPDLKTNPIQKQEAP